MTTAKRTVLSPSVRTGLRTAPLTRLATSLPTAGGIKPVEAKGESHSAGRQIVREAPVSSHGNPTILGDGPTPCTLPVRRRPGRTDGITPRFEDMLREANRTGFEAGYRAAFQSMGLDARAVRVLCVVSVRDIHKALAELSGADRIAVLRRLDQMPPGDD